MSPRRILVTGAGGFVGKHLLPLLAAALPDAQVAAPNFDVTDAAATLAVVQRIRPDACIHLAAVAAIADARSDPERAWRVNLHGSLILARALAEAAPGGTLVFISTADAYGHSFRPGLPVNESVALAPLNIYGATKAAADLALGAMASTDLRIIRLRPFNHTGPGQSASFVVPAFARQIARVAAGLQPPRLQVGALEPRRDFLDVRDVCAAYVQCLLRADQVESGTILNIASGMARRIGDVLNELLSIAGVSAELEQDAGRLRAVDIPLASGDSSAASMLLDWAPRIAWRTTLADVFADWTTRIRQE